MITGTCNSRVVVFTFIYTHHRRTDSRENRNEDVEKNIRSNIERQSKECGHQKGSRCE